jgi:hypothetical protein
VIFEADSHLKQIEGFNGCVSLIRMNIPASVKVICNRAFSGCSGLREVIFEAAVTSAEWMDSMTVFH